MKTIDQKMKIRLFVSDIDGTLIPQNKKLTQETINTARKLKKADIALSLVSSRPVSGMKMFLDPLEITTPFAALNGGEIVGKDRKVITSTVIESDKVSLVYKILQNYPVNIWIFSKYDWHVLNKDDSLVSYEEKVTQTVARPVHDLQDHTEDVIKIMAISQKAGIFDQIIRDFDKQLAGALKAIQSGEPFLDITNPQANKGFAVEQLGKALGISLEETACIGDMNNDIPMLKKAGLSIAMGQSTPEVQSYADVVTKSNDENGWAYAVEHYILS